MSDQNESQLLSFVMYSMFIYPIANYLVAPQRKYGRNTGTLYAIIFLAIVSYLHITYENLEKGPNYYELYSLPRNAATSAVKKAFRQLSLELHPDKNKSEEAVEGFHFIKHAYDILLRADLRRAYDFFGETGTKMAIDSVLDDNAIIFQMLIYYVSAFVLVIFITFFERSGEAFTVGIFGIVVMLFVELNVLSFLEFFSFEWLLPVWAFPTTTPNEFISTMHRLFPAFVSGTKCIVSSYYVDYDAVRIAQLKQLVNSRSKWMLSLLQHVQSRVGALDVLLMINQRDSSDTETETETETDPVLPALECSNGTTSVNCEETLLNDATDENGNNSNSKRSNRVKGLMELGLEKAALWSCDYKERERVHQQIEQTNKLIADPNFLRSRRKISNNENTQEPKRSKMTFWELLRNIFVFLMLFYVMSKFRSS